MTSQADSGPTGAGGPVGGTGAGESTLPPAPRARCPRRERGAAGASTLPQSLAELARPSARPRTTRPPAHDRWAGARVGGHHQGRKDHKGHRDHGDAGQRGAGMVDGAADVAYEESGRLVNVVDVEATCWSGQAPPGQVSEIIEIGLCVVDVVARERVSRHRLLVRPTRSTVSAFCTELTGLTQAEVDGGMPFADACAALVREHRAAVRAWASWGDYDRKQFARQCERGPARYPFSQRHLNAKAAFTTAYGLRKRPGMAQALQVAGLPLEGRHHRGVDDAWNIGALLLEVLGRGEWPLGEGVGPRG